MLWEIPLPALARFARCNLRFISFRHWREDLPWRIGIRDVAAGQPRDTFKQNGVTLEGEVDGRAQLQLRRNLDRIIPLAIALSSSVCFDVIIVSEAKLGVLNLDLD